MPFHFTSLGNTNPRQPSDPNVEQAIVERDRFLKHCLHMNAYQKKIDSVLDKSGDSHGRMAVPETMIQGTLLDMRKAFYDLALDLGEMNRQ